MKHKKIAFLSLPIIAILSGCGGGGGGGGGGSSITYRNITANFSEDLTNVRASLSGGISNETNYTWSSSSGLITGISDIGGGSTGATITATYDSNSDYAAAGFTTAGGTTVTFDSNDTFGTFVLDSDFVVAEQSDGTEYFVAANPYDVGFDYQTFGTWATGVNSGSGKAGAISAGFVTTDISELPTSGSATYTGITGGRYVDSDGDYGWTKSTLSASANFASRQLAVTSSGTYYTNQAGTSSSGSNGNLNFTGTLSYSSSSPVFTGTITTTGGDSGTMTGRFYGSNYEEIGGTFGINAASGQTLDVYAGGFGATR